MVEITTIDQSDGQGDDNGGWNELMGSDLVMKVLGSTGESKGIEPNEAFLVTFEGRIANDRTMLEGALFQKAESWLIVVGESDVVPALDMGIRHMKVGQTALVWSHYRFALGNGTRTIIGKKDDSAELGSVPPNSNVMYKVTVTQKVMDTSRLNPYFTIQKALTRKKIANDIYQNEWCKPPETEKDPNCEFAMKRAVRLYTRAAQEMETLLQGTYFQNVEKEHPQRDQSRQIQLDSLNNIVAVRLKQKNYHGAKTAAVEVLKVDPSNTKALLRAGKAALMDPASTIEEASAAIQAAESSISKSFGNKKMDQKELKRLKVTLKEKEADYKEKTKEMFGNKLRSRPATVSKRQDHEPISTVKSGTIQQQGKTSGSLFGRKEMYTLMMQTIVPLIVWLLIKYVYDKGVAT